MMNAIAAGHELTLQTAKEILHAGGNAFDAAIAAYLTMFVTEPFMASAGGAGFAMTHHQGQTRFYDFFCQTPSAKKHHGEIDFKPITVDFGAEQEVFHIGLASSAVPGTIAGIFKLHEDFGSMPFGELIAIPSKLAKEGVLLNSFQAHDLELLAPIAFASEKGKEIFYKNDQRKVEGDMVKLPQMADFLSFLADEGRQGFYQGEIAASIEKHAIENGGFLRRIDFENYKVEVSTPYEIPYKNKLLQLSPLSSLGGMLMAIVFSRLSNFDLATALVETNAFLQDHQGLVNTFIAETGIDPNLNISSSSTKGTSHFNIKDKDGNAVALTTSIGEGSAYYIPNTDMQLNNMLGEAFLIPEGFHNWRTNSRMKSMMSPTMILNEDQEMIFAGGSGGASRIPFVITQVLLNLFEREMTLAEAIKAPRMHFQEGILNLEMESLLQGLKYEGRKKVWNEFSVFFGGVHAIAKQGKHWSAVGDQRREGIGEVF